MRSLGCYGGVYRQEKLIGISFTLGSGMGTRSGLTGTCTASENILVSYMGLRSARVSRT